MNREIRISYLWQDGENWIKKTYNLNQIEAGDQFDDMSDCPFLKNYRIIARRQCTGLLDKNGKEIYEGDIIENERLGIHVAEWAADIAGFVFDDKKGGEDWQYILDIGGTEIIGNIYENPELLGIHEN